MSEFEPEEVLNIQLNGEDFEINRNNTSLFTFIGRNAIKNHVFLVLEDNGDGSCEGSHIWEKFQEGAYIALENHIIANDYPQHINLNQVSQIDEDAFEGAVKAQLSDVGDYIPDDFKLGGDSGTA